MLLYKYFAPSRSGFLEKPMVRFTPPSFFNDPFDCLPATDGFGIPQIRDLVDRNKHFLASQIALETIPEDIRQLKLMALELSSESLFKDYCKDPGARGDMYLDFLRKRMSRQIGVLCLCTTPKNTLMWSHYSQEHEGFVVGFNSKHEFFCHRHDEPDEIGRLCPIKYVEKRPSIDIRRIDDPTYIPDFIFAKSRDWKYEQEWRIVRFVKNASDTPAPNVHLFNVPSDAILEVIFGYRAEKSLVDDLLSAANMKHLKFFKASISRKSYEMDILPLKRDYDAD
jgi:hypothetical protein